MINHRWAAAFNDWINKWGLVELNSTNKLFTWTNNQDNLILAKIDRIFISTEWGAAFPLARVKALDRPPSDHNPLLLDAGCNLSFGKKCFCFEKWWLKRDSFKKVVLKAWNTPCLEPKPLDVLQFRIRTLRRLVRGWASNEVAALNKQKAVLSEEYNKLDVEAEQGLLTAQGLSRLKLVADELDKFWGLKEIKARQRSRYIRRR